MVGARRKLVRKKKCNPRKYSAAHVAELLVTLRGAVLQASGEGRTIWNLDEVHFKLSDHNHYAWALPNEVPEIVEAPVRGLKTCSCIVAFCVKHGTFVWELSQKFQKKEDVVRFVNAVACATPPQEKLAILLDNAASHKARLVRDRAAVLDIPLLFNLPYHCVFNGIENIFANVKQRFRKKLTVLKIDDALALDLAAVIQETFDETETAKATNLCMLGWRKLLAPDPRSPQQFQGQQLKK